MTLFSDAPRRPKMKKFQVKRERGGDVDECALIKICARTMAAAA